MAKTCNKDGCSNPRFGGGFCLYHQGFRTDKKFSAQKKQRKRISPIAAKRAEELKKYRFVRDVYMAKHPKCECGCGRDSEDLHHMNGRSGKMVYNVKYFMAVSRYCHNRIHNNPAWARKMGYLTSKEK